MFSILSYPSGRCKSKSAINPQIFSFYGGKPVRLPQPAFLREASLKSFLRKLMKKHDFPSCHHRTNYLLKFLGSLATDMTGSKGLPNRLLWLWRVDHARPVRALLPELFVSGLREAWLGKPALGSLERQREEVAHGPVQDLPTVLLGAKGDPAVRVPSAREGSRINPAALGRRVRDSSDGPARRAHEGHREPLCEEGGLPRPDAPR